MDFKDSPPLVHRKMESSTRTQEKNKNVISIIEASTSEPFLLICHGWSEDWSEMMRTIFKLSSSCLWTHHGKTFVIKLNTWFYGLVEVGQDWSWTVQRQWLTDQVFAQVLLAAIHVPTRT